MQATETNASVNCNVDTRFRYGRGWFALHSKEHVSHTLQLLLLRLVLKCKAAQASGFQQSTQLGKVHQVQAKFQCLLHVQA